ncbi:MAG: SGNH/GDSL hydrolase family protein [Anditalea sp.]
MNLQPLCSPMIKYGIILTLLFGFGIQTQAQDPLRFQEEVDQLTLKYGDAPRGEDLILFTGSSSVKGWRDLSAYFPDHQMINAGFGGSQTSDLLHYVDELIIQYQPKKVFIYEGDNDISAGKSTEEILEDTHELVEKIKSKLPETKILLISAKPSISRWHLRDKYLDLNQHFEEYSQSHENVDYVDVWTTMLDEEGKPKADIFLEDNLHMNKAGYDLWAEVIGKYMD